MPTGDQRELATKALELIREVILHDEELRVKYQVGDKFRFVRDRLRALSEQLDADLKITAVFEEKVEREKAADETYIFVYLYNTNGLTLRTWQSLLLPKLFYEFSVNRPIYADQSHILSLIKSKATQTQHGFLTIVVKSADIIQPAGESPKDALGNPVVKVREGSIRFQNLISFTHNGHEYIVSELGELTKKD